MGKACGRRELYFHFLGVYMQGTGVDTRLFIAEKMNCNEISRA
jgi:hypothetical protein